MQLSWKKYDKKEEEEEEEEECGATVKTNNLSISSIVSMLRSDWGKSKEQSLQYYPLGSNSLRPNQCKAC